MKKLYLSDDAFRRQTHVATTLSKLATITQGIIWAHVFVIKCNTVVIIIRRNLPLSFLPQRRQRERKVAG
jgi:hypothetical protein